MEKSNLREQIKILLNKHKYYNDTDFSEKSQDKIANLFAKEILQLITAREEQTVERLVTAIFRHDASSHGFKKSQDLLDAIQLIREGEDGSK